MDRLSVEGPREVTLYVTAACDASCAFCKRESADSVHKAGTMSLATAREILDTFPSLRGCCIAGFGEPLLVPHLGDVCRLLRERGVYIGLITNGSQLLRRVGEVAAWDLGYLSISINAVTEAEHQAVFSFKHPAWDAMRAGARAALAAGVNVGASFVVTRANVRKVPAMIALANDLGLHFVHLHGLLPHAGPHHVAFLGGVIRAGSEEAALLDEYRRLPGAEVIAGWPVALPRPEAMPLRCQSPFMSIGVDAHGNVSGCRRVAEPAPEYGTFRDAGVWTNAHFTRYRRELAGELPASDTCKACFGAIKG